MHRLRELGYKGRFHVLVPYWSQFDDKMGRNIAQLIPGYDPSNRSTQEVGLCTIDRYDIAHKVLDLPPVSLTISPANDFDMIADRAFVTFNSACYLSMQPTGWRFPNVWYNDALTEKRTYVAEGTVLFSEKEASAPLGVLPERLRSFFQKIAFLKECGCLTQSLYGFNVEEKENPAYSPDSKVRDDDFQSNQRYIKTGWINPELELTRLIQGAVDAQSQLNKPITLLFHSPQELISANFKHSGYLRNLEASGKKIIFLNGLDADPNTASEHYDKNTIVIWLTGPVSHDAFRQLMFDSDLPPVVEGANTTGFLEANRGYLHGGQAQYSFWNIPDEYFTKHGVDLDLRKCHLAANKVLEKTDPTRENPLGSFYVDVLAGKYDHYFAVCARYFREERPDAALEGIEAVKESPIFTKAFNEIELFKNFVALLNQDLKDSYLYKDNVMNLVQRIVLLKARLGVTLDEESVNDFKLAMSTTTNHLFVALAEAKKKSKDYGFTINDEQELRRHILFINQAVFPDNPLNILELEEQFYQKLCQENAATMSSRPASC